MSWSRYGAFSAAWAARPLVLGWARGGAAAVRRLMLGKPTPPGQIFAEMCGGGAINSPGGGGGGEPRLSRRRWVGALQRLGLEGLCARQSEGLFHLMLRGGGGGGGGDGAAAGGVEAEAEAEATVELHGFLAVREAFPCLCGPFWLRLAHVAPVPTTRLRMETPPPGSGCGQTVEVLQLKVVK
jgi:hypothetical protein